MERKIKYKEINGELHAILPETDDKNEKIYFHELKKSGIPKDYWDIEFEDYEGDKSRDSLGKAILYATNCKHQEWHNINLFLEGDNSCQKTMVACNIGKEFIRQGLKVRFILSGDLISALMKTQGYGIDGDSEKIKKELFSSDLVIIDEGFDSKKSMKWNTENNKLIVSEWDRLFRKLISNDIRIIVPSNCSLEYIKVHYSQDLYRLFERNFYVLKFEDSVINKRRKRFEVFGD